MLALADQTPSFAQVGLLADTERVSPLTAFVVVIPNGS